MAREYIYGALTAITLASIGYIIYLDSQLKNPANRRQIKQERKKMKQLQQEQLEKQKSKANTAAASVIPLDFLNELENEPLPTTPADKEAYFMKQLEAGEKLMAQGPTFYEAAAGCFYRVLKIYPDPMQLLMIIEQTVAPPVFNIVMEKMAKDIRNKQEEYKNIYPDASMNVKITENVHGVTPEGNQLIRRGLVVTKSFKEGEVIYTESPLVSSLFPDLIGTSYCSYCLDFIPEDAITMSFNSDGVESPPNFCCEACCQNYWKKAGAFLYADAQDPTLPVEMQKVTELQPKTQMAQDGQNLLNYCKTHNTVTPLMVVGLLSTMILEETEKAKTGQGVLYGIYDHVDRFHYLDLAKESVLMSGDKKWIADLKEIEQEFDLVSKLFTGVAGFDKFLTMERYMVLKGKFLYNMIGISSAKSPQESSKCQEQSRTNADPQTLVGAGLYHISTFLSHSCDPNTVFEFKETKENSGNVLILKAVHDLKEGDEIFTGFIFDQEKTRKQRREELKYKYRFICKCSECEKK